MYRRGLPQTVSKRVLNMVPKLEEQNRIKAEQNFKNKMNKNGFVHLNRNIYYHKNGRFYFKNQGPKSNANISKKAKALLKNSIVFSQTIPKEEEAGRTAGVKFMKDQLKAMINQLNAMRNTIFLVPKRRPTKKL
jgi:hypothetical protein